MHKHLLVHSWRDVADIQVRCGWVAIIETPRIHSKPKVYDAKYEQGHQKDELVLGRDGNQFCYKENDKRLLYGRLKSS